jgi:hypothetical protein
MPFNRLPVFLTLAEEKLFQRDGAVGIFYGLLCAALAITLGAARFGERMERHVRPPRALRAGESEDDPLRETMHERERAQRPREAPRKGRVAHERQRGLDGHLRQTPGDRCNAGGIPGI